MELIKKRFFVKKTEVLFSPVQLTPSPEYPGLQVHTKDPLVFWQLAFTAQLCFPTLHSFISAKKEVRHWMIKTDFLFLLQQLLWPIIVSISWDQFLFSKRGQSSNLSPYPSKLIFISKGFPLRLVLRQKLQSTRKWLKLHTDTANHKL